MLDFPFHSVLLNLVIIKINKYMYFPKWAKKYSATKNFRVCTLTVKGSPTHFVFHWVKEDSEFFSFL